MPFSLYSGNQQKEHIDEGLERVLEKNGWEQSFAAEFTRLGFGFAGVFVALYVWYLEKTTPFRDSRGLVGALCVLYFTFTWGAWLYQKQVEKNATFIGYKGESKLWIATKNPRNTDKYEITIHVKSASTEPTHAVSHTILIQEVVDTMGVVHEEKLSKILDLINSSKGKKSE